MIGVWFIALMLAVVIIFAPASTRRRRCECVSFTPNPHDGDCAVCRGYEP